MNVFISHRSALYMYRKLRSMQHINILSLSDENVLLSPNINRKSCQYAQELLKEFGNSFEILISDKRKKHIINNFITRTSKLNFPQNSFLEFSDKIYLCRPELMFYQLAEFLTLEELILVGMEICGNYAIKNQNQELVCNLAPITNKNKIFNYLTSLKNINKECHGINKA